MTGDLFLLSNWRYYYWKFTKNILIQICHGRTHTIQ